MAKIPVSPQTRLRNNNEENHLAGLANDQLIKLKKAVAKEIDRRCKNQITREDMAAKLKAAEMIVPAIYYRAADIGLSQSSPASIRQEHLNQPAISNIKYLKKLLSQDWSFLWPERNTERRFCVYAHVEPNGQIFSFAKTLGGTCRAPFYIGKGTIDRANDLNRNQGHGIRIKQLLTAGHSKQTIVRVLCDKLTEAEAFELESKLIYYFGTIYEKGRKGILLNLDLSLRPEFERQMDLIVNPAKSKKAIYPCPPRAADRRMQG